MSTLKQALSETPKPYEKRWYPSSDLPAVGVLLTEDQAREALAARLMDDKTRDAIGAFKNLATHYPPNDESTDHVVGDLVKTGLVLVAYIESNYLTAHSRDVSVIEDKIKEHEQSN